MTLQELYAIDGSIKTFVQWVKDRHRCHCNCWALIRPFLKEHVGWERGHAPTQDTLPLYTAEAYELVLREIYPYVD